MLIGKLYCQVIVSQEKVSHEFAVKGLNFYGC